VTPRLGEAADFAAVRGFLIDAGYTEAALLERMGIDRLSRSARLRAAAPPDDLLDALLFALLLGQPTPLPEELTRPMSALGLGETTAEGFAASVELYPVGGLYFISDRTRGAALAPGEDRVFSVISPQTEDFLAALPQTPCPSLLELCAGAGAAALIGAARYAAQAFAFDLSARSTLFAACNARLNGVENFTALRGDMYQPAGRRTYDRIVAHPPYVPTLRATELLRDGGEEGETLTRRAVQGAATHLHPGGRLYCLALVARRAGEPIAERVRGWLGPAGGDFDVLVAARGAMDPARMVFDNWRPRDGEVGDMARWQTIFRERRIEAFVYSTIVVERRAAARAPRTIGVECGSPYPAAAVEALLAPERELDELRPTAAEGVTVAAVSRREGGEWREVAWRYECARPFRFAWEGPEWVRRYLAACDGARTCREHREALAGVDAAEFENVTRRLIAGGVLCG
jgi:methylase of polypeptide subunit release factors